LLNVPLQVQDLVNTEIDWLGLVLCCLTPLSTIFQLYRGGQFIGGEN
jgi:hypothetical protein